MKLVRTSRLRTVVAVLCVLVIVLAASAEARHLHASGSREAQRCSVCVSAHAPILVSHAAAVAPEKVSAPLAPVMTVAFVSSVHGDAHSIRPPPAPESL